MNAGQLYIQDLLSEQIRLTKAGLNCYAACYAKVGYRVSELKTLEELWNAIDASFDQEMAELATTARGHNADLDKIMRGLPGWD
jgi:hypothetical protein